MEVGVIEVPKELVNTKLKGSLLLTGITSVLLL